MTLKGLRPQKFSMWDRTGIALMQLLTRESDMRCKVEGSKCFVHFFVQLDRDYYTIVKYLQGSHSS